MPRSKGRRAARKPGVPKHPVLSDQQGQREADTRRSVPYPPSVKVKSAGGRSPPRDPSNAHMPRAQLIRKSATRHVDSQQHRPIAEICVISLRGRENSS